MLYLKLILNKLKETKFAKEKQEMKELFYIHFYINL